MIDFSTWLDLPFIWGFLIATAIFLYVILDGFDLGCGILFPFAPSGKCRDRIMNSIAPFWDGNETWLVLGGGGLFAAFPVAYAILMSALYIPITLMLIGLVFRGVAFEFRFKASEKGRKLWDVMFHAGSLLATFMQGVVLGNFIQGVEVAGRNFSGGVLDWANAFAILTGISLIFGYALIGSTWLIMKTENETLVWARKSAKYVLVFVALAIGIISITMPYFDDRIIDLWFSAPNIFLLMPMPVLSIIIFIVLWIELCAETPASEIRPFFLTLFLFLLAYIGFGVSFYPWIVPFSFTIWDAAAAPTSQSLLLIGTVALLPLILTYTGYCYYIFRGKSEDKALY